MVEDYYKRPVPSNDEANRITEATWLMKRAVNYSFAGFVLEIACIIMLVFGQGIRVVFVGLAALTLIGTGAWHKYQADKIYPEGRDWRDRL